MPVSLRCSEDEIVAKDLPEAPFLRNLLKGVFFRQIRGD